MQTVKFPGYFTQGQQSVAETQQKGDVGCLSENVQYLPCPQPGGTHATVTTPACDRHLTALLLCLEMREKVSHPQSHTEKSDSRQRAGFGQHKARSMDFRLPGI